MLARIWPTMFIAFMVRFQKFHFLAYFEANSLFWKRKEKKYLRSRLVPRVDREEADLRTDPLTA